MIATLRKVWGLGDPFTARDAAAAPFDHLLFREAPRDPASWPDVEALPVPELQLDMVQMGKALSTLGKTMGGGLLEHAREAGYAVRRSWPTRASRRQRNRSSPPCAASLTSSSRDLPPTPRPAYEATARSNTTCSGFSAMGRPDSVSANQTSSSRDPRAASSMRSSTAFASPSTRQQIPLTMTISVLGVSPVLVRRADCPAGQTERREWYPGSPGDVTPMGHTLGSAQRSPRGSGDSGPVRERALPAVQGEVARSTPHQPAATARAPAGLRAGRGAPPLCTVRGATDAGRRPVRRLTAPPSALPRPQGRWEPRTAPMT